MEGVGSTEGHSGGSFIRVRKKGDFSHLLHLLYISTYYEDRGVETVISASEQK